MSIVFEHEAEATTRAITATLAQHGLSAVRSFDLRSALAHHSDCECPHHGTADCNCQFVVLLIYGQDSSRSARVREASQHNGGEPPPVVLTCHCQDSRTEVQLVQDANFAHDPELAEQVSLALLEAASALQATPGILVEASRDAR